MLVKLEPIIPFESVVTDEIPTDSNWIGQIKWDGERILTYYDGKTVRLFNRKRNERTAHYPEFTDVSRYAHAKSLILDGEIIALKDGKPSFYEVMKRDGIRRLDRVHQVKKQVPVTYMVFDILFADGKWLVHLPLEERQDFLQKLIIPQEDVHIVGNVEDKEALFSVMQDKKMEGIVLKDLSSSYVIGGKDNRWRKKKCYRELIAAVGGVTVRGKIVQSLLLGLFDEYDRFLYIGHAGTGKLKQKDWHRLSEYLPHIQQEKSPFYNLSTRYEKVIWVKPMLTVKVRYIQWEKGHSLRQPSIQAWTNVPAQQCRFKEKYQE